LGTRRLPPSLLNCGKLEAVRLDQPRKIGLMQRNNLDPAVTTGEAGDAVAPQDQPCPKCGTEMESIEAGVDGPHVQDLQLCPNCYLVTWRDTQGPHFRQGVPVKPGVDPLLEIGSMRSGEPQDC
jgi:hypothetical protein